MSTGSGRLFLALATTAAALLRMTNIGGESLWFDESLSHWFSGRPMAELWGSVPLYETHPPAYYTILKFWRAIFGDSETALRGLSALAGTAVVPAAYFTGIAVAGASFGRGVGAAAAVFCALSPLYLLHSQEARPYPMLTLAAAVAMWGAFWLLANPRPASIPYWGAGRTGEADGRGAMAAWFALVFGAAGSLWLHNMSVLFIAALLATILPALMVRTSLSRPLMVNALLAGGAIFLIWAPFIPMLVKQTANVKGNFWLPDEGAGAFFQRAQYLLLPHTGGWPARALFFAMAALGYRVLAKERGAAAAICLAGMTAIPIALIIAVSHLYTPVFVARTILWTAIPFYVAAGAGLAAVARWRLAVGVPLIVLWAAMFLAGDWVYFHGAKKEPWRELAQYMASATPGGGKLLVLPNSLEIPLAYYSSKLNLGLSIKPLPAPFPAMGLNRAYPSGNAAEPGLAKEDARLLDEADCGSHPVWLVLKSPSLYDPEGVALGSLSERCQLSDAKKHKLIYIFLFTAKTGQPPNPLPGGGG